MPFAKRVVLPQRLCRATVATAPCSGFSFSELGDVCAFTLHSVLRQLADVCRHAASITQELEGDLLSLCHRSRLLEERFNILQRHLHSWRRGGRIDAASIAEKPVLQEDKEKHNSSASSSLNLENKKTAHFKSSWQQHVNVFHSSSRPPCVEELHQEAQLNLQSLLQEQYEEQHADSRLTGQSFCSSFSPHLPACPEASSKHPTKRVELILLPTTKRVCQDETTTIGIRPQGTIVSLPTTPEKQITWNKAFPLPVLEERRWHPSSSAQAKIVPINVSGNCQGSKQQLINSDIIPSALSLELTNGGHPPSQPTVVHGLRKTHSNLEQITQTKLLQTSSSLPNTGMLCTSPQWNGPKDSTFSPSWNSSGGSFSFVAPSSPILEHTDSPTEEVKCSLQCDSGLSLNTGLHSDSETAVKDANSLTGDLNANGHSLCVSGVIKEQQSRSPKANMNKNLFRQRSLSTPTDSDSFCSMDNVCNEDNKIAEEYALRYPSASSEGSTSTDNISVTTEHEGQQRRRIKSFSLKKAKKKPTPPQRSVSLMKEMSAYNSKSNELSLKNQRPKSLCIPIDHKDSDRPQFLHHWNLNDWKPNDPYHSLSSSSTATGTTVIECVKVNDSSESLTSPSTSRATTPSAGPESKPSSPGKPQCLMSPSSGYSSQSETPTSTIPTSLILGHSSHHIKARPQVPERKSSLLPASPTDRCPISRLSFELPIIPPPHVELSSFKVNLRSKTKAGRRHSDSSTCKLGPRLSPNQPVMPMVTQSDLRSIRLRSVSKSEPEDNVDGFDEQEEHEETVVTPQNKTKPPVAEKPPLCRRPQSLFQPRVFYAESELDSPASSVSSPISLIESNFVPNNIYTVIKKPKNKKNQAVESKASLVLSSQTLPPPQQKFEEFPDPLRDHFQHCTEDSESKKLHLPDRISLQNLSDGERKKSKVPPPVPKKPSVLYLPGTPTQPLRSTETLDQWVSSSPVMTVDTNTITASSVASAEAVVESLTHNSDNNERPGQKIHAENSSQVLQSKTAYSITNSEGNNREHAHIYSASDSNLVGSSEDGSIEERSPASDTKTVTTPADDDDEVFVQSASPRTTEDLFTVIHRSKRKVLGWKEPRILYSGRSSSHSPIKSPSTSATDEQKLDSPGNGSGTTKSISRNEDFKALLQKKGIKLSSSARTSAAELLKTTNPLARRIMTEFSQELDSPGGSDPQS
ncbi:NHS-like protein 2 isoform X2 [Protopterus annectens]|uniref:NHS-like protein 2 isoform X2 n=1 Tax=Protopterus annectens TaxID=7888 RepID=UPI001CFBBB7D|nr:NHS-like protein 2 isoform X2 [Protopterus annectens]